MKNRYLLIALLLFPFLGFTQTNIFLTNAEFDTILKGQHDPTAYSASTLIDHPDDIFPDIIANISPDSMKNYLIQLSTFENRNTGSDTTSNSFGMGAARRWCMSKMNEFSANNENRLITSYLQFDEDICGMGQHRNVLSILPGTGPLKDEVIIIEGHLDSRCEDRCDVLCTAHGMEDNGSGSALVLELARVMSKYTFNRSIVFMLTTGEEQGLFGADAFATYCQDESINVIAVYNNDIVGGIICGATASPPGCPGLNDIDSINVRIYSQGSLNSRNKGLARFVKLEYQENIAPFVPVQTVINLMSPEDRSGRGGDHIPFRQKGFKAIRFTSANEHGDANPVPGYEDRQHSANDFLGVDTDGDSVLDSFFVDFNYLARNAIINANAAASTAMGPIAPTDFNLQGVENGLEININDPNNYGLYRVGLRDFSTHDWDTLITLTQPLDTIYGLEPGLYIASACTVDSNGIESLFSSEEFDNFSTDVEDIDLTSAGITLLQNRPNPFDEATTIGVLVEKTIDYQEAQILVFDISGKELVRYPIALNLGLQEILYDYQNHRYQPGIYSYSLVIDGKLIATKQMVYAY